MSIPRIAPYPLPTRDEIPAARAPFSPDPDRALLLVHDMQEHFVDYFARDESPARELIANIARLRDACDARGVPVAYSAQPSDATHESRGLLNPMWGPGILARPELEGIVPELTPRPHHTPVPKHRYSALHDTSLHASMREQGRDQLWVCGIYAHIGCLFTASDAFMLGIEPFLITDALGDFSRAQHDQAVSIVADCCGGAIDTEALCQTLAQGGDTANNVAQWLEEELLRLEVSVAEMGPQDALMDHGLDSVRLLELSERLAERGAPVTFMDMAEHTTLGAMRDYVTSVGAEMGG